MTEPAPVQSLPLVARGKVRDIYALGDERLLIVASDRLSAFDVILPDPIPGKGAILTAMSNFWFGRTRTLIRNHLTGIDPRTVVSAAERDRVHERAVVVERLTPLPIEAVVRGFVAGSGWKDYQRSGRICGIELPPGLAQAERLPQPLFTPATKAAAHTHDENITFDTMVGRIGAEMSERVRDVSLTLYRSAAAYAETRGIIIADTKFEFGLDHNGELVVMDEMLTPDSSRFWPADEYRTGISPPSFDKQFVRDYLETLDWDKTDPGPKLPPEIIERTAAKYREARDRLLDSLPGDGSA